MDPYTSIAVHHKLICDRQRMDAYRLAISESVKPGDVVLDIGCGTGVLGLMACQAGAKRVYAVERTDIIEVAREMAKTNHVARRMRFLHGDADSIALPEPVDVIVSELISKAVLGQRMEELLARARKQFLKPGGIVIPVDTEFRVAPVEEESAYGVLEPPDSREYGIDFSVVRNLMLNNIMALRANPGGLLAPDQVAYRVEAENLAGSSHPRARLVFRVQRPGRLHGFCGWFTARLSERVRLDATPPGLMSWDNVLYPLPRPVAVEPGMTVDLDLRGVQPPSGGAIWHWSTRVQRGRRQVAVFAQSTFRGSMVARRTLLRSRPTTKPALSGWGEIERAILCGCDGESSIRQIAERVMDAFPGIFSSREQAEDVIQGVLFDRTGPAALAEDQRKPT